jgi:hypothetical protein
VNWFLNDAYIDIHLDIWRRECARRSLLPKLPHRERTSALERIRDLLAERGRRGRAGRIGGRLAGRSAWGAGRKVEP